MSGGAFDYKQHHIEDIADQIEDIVRKNKVEKSKEDLERWDYDEEGNVYEDSRYYYYYGDDTIEHFKEAVKVLRKAAVYAQRVDWLLSGDDDEKYFHKRLEEELKKLEEDK